MKPHKNIYSSFYPIYICLSFAGVVPFKFNSKRYQNSVDKNHQFLSIAILLFAISSQCIIVFTCNRTQDFSSRLNKFLTADSTVLFSFFFIYFYLKRTALMVLLRNINDLDAQLKFNRGVNADFRKYLILNCFVLFVILTLNTLFFIYFDTKENWVCTVSRSNNIVFNFLLIRLPFLFFVMEIKARYRYLSQITCQNNPESVNFYLIQLKQVCKSVNALYNLPLARNCARIFFVMTGILLITLLERTNRLLLYLITYRVFVLTCDTFLFLQPVEDLYSEVTSNQLLLILFTLKVSFQIYASYEKIGSSLLKRQFYNKVLTEKR